MNSSHTPQEMNALIRPNENSVRRWIPRVRPTQPIHSVRRLFGDFVRNVMAAEPATAIRIIDEPKSPDRDDDGPGLQWPS